jgi:hypothetical protein
VPAKQINHANVMEGETALCRHLHGITSIVSHTDTFTALMS